MGITPNRSAWFPPPEPRGFGMPMLLWRLHNDHDDYADCSLQMTHTGGYTIRIRQGGDLKFTALATDWRAARQVIADLREELLRQGWKHTS